ncbi:hypothetical protein RHS04_07837 [Rhizoctonia solani]|uniref:DUF6535 domain-containing protein n=1 Tax=Rhizoctonia solani TaxID=456999 RepID=A0A8H7LH14_9AGAM|nr:hypothetical protein RHS04_07837 [Rhizoctonia solani]
MSNTLLPRRRGTQNVNQAVHEAEENPSPKDIQNDSKLNDAPEGDIGPNAEVWKKYVIETDRADKELVEGWNKFILESTKDLKPDYAEVSAHTLAAVLAALSPTTSDNSSGVPTMGQSNFAPTAAAIQVNILWFTSLSLSVAVALIAIIAKDWCYQFTAKRTGPMLIQGRRRQLRWQGIEQWRMQEILNVLPLMMHAALLLFAVGLSLYLWDINPQVALPVVVTTTAVGVFYFVTLLLPLFFRYCPFTTGVMKLFLPYWYTVAKSTFKSVFKSLGWLVVPFIAAFAVMKRCLKRSPTRRSNRESEDQKSGLRCWAAQLSFSGCWDQSKWLVMQRVEVLFRNFMADETQLDRQDTPMDNTTSLMLGWMIAQCENVESVDTALRALLCAKPWLPRLPLQTCGALEATLTRLSTDLVAWMHIRRSNGDESTKLRRSVIVQSQCLSMMSQIEEIKLPEQHIRTVEDLYMVLDNCWDGSEYKEASGELGSLSLHIPSQWHEWYTWRGQSQRQWELVEKIIKQEVTNLSASDITHLVDGIAKSYLYEPDQSPAPLAKLLDTKTSRENTQLRRMIGIALTIGYISKHGNGGGSTAPDSASRSKQARKIYIDLTTARPQYDGWDDSNELLLYGLLGALLTCSESRDSDDAKAIIDALYNDKYQILQTGDLHEYLKLPQDPIAILSKLIAPGMLSDTHNAPPTITASSHAAADVTLEMDATLPIAVLGSDDGESSSHVRMYLDDSNSLKLTICLLRFARGLSINYYSRSSSDPWKPAEDTVHSAIDAIIRSELHVRAYHTIQSHTSDLVPHCMCFLWWFARALLDKCPYYKRSRALVISSILGQIGAPEGDVPEDVDGMEYTESWIEKIRIIRKPGLQSVLDSQILYWMIDHYDSYDLRDKGPSSPDAPGSGPPTTWLTILRDLKKACEDKVVESDPKVDQGGQEQEAPLAEGAVDGLVAESTSAAVPDGEPKDGQDTTQEMHLDCLPPEVLECAPSDMWLSPVSESSDQGQMEGLGHE